jgi:hypothetical protein
VFTTVLAVGAFSYVASIGGELVSPPIGLWVGLFALVIAVAAFVAQPPPVGSQRPLWSSVQGLGPWLRDRVLQARRRLTAGSSRSR